MKIKVYQKIATFFCITLILSILIIFIIGMVALFLEVIGVNYHKSYLFWSIVFCLFGIFLFSLCGAGLLLEITARKFKKMSICPRCEGKNVARCPACSGTGKYMPEVYNRWKEEQSAREEILGHYDY
ncbi:MAG: hypothetical protein AB1465_00715 [Patescibacteria group bacterium]